MLRKCSIFFILIFCIIMFLPHFNFAQQPSGTSDSLLKKQTIQVYVGQDIELAEIIYGVHIFFFSKLELSGKLEGSLIVIGGKTSVRGLVAGDIHCIRSDMFFADNTNISGRIINYNNLTIYYSFLGFINSIFGIIILSIFKNFFEQGVTVALNEPKEIMKSGALFFIALIALIFIFTISVAGFPIVILLLLLFILISSAGQISLCIYIAYLINAKICPNITNLYTFSLYFIGSLIIESIKLIPVLGNVFMIIVVPILSFGFLIKTFLNIKLYRIFYRVPFKTSLETEQYNRAEKQYIIMRGVKKTRK